MSLAYQFVFLNSYFITSYANSYLCNESQPDSPMYKLFSSSKKDIFKKLH